MVYICFLILFCVGCYNSVKDLINIKIFIVIDIYCILSIVGGNGNGVIV